MHNFSGLAAIALCCNLAAAQPGDEDTLAPTVPGGRYLDPEAAAAAAAAVANQGR